MRKFEPIFVSPRCFLDLTNVTLADEETNPRKIDIVKKVKFLENFPIFASKCKRSYKYFAWRKCRAGWAFLSRPGGGSTITQGGGAVLLLYHWSIRVVYT